MKKKQERARDLLIKWAGKDMVRCFYSDRVFVIERVPKDFLFAWSEGKVNIKSNKAKNITIGK